MSLGVLPTSESVTWSEAVGRMDWRQGEHVTLIGPTGVGKTELMAKLLGLPPWWVFFSTKRIDTTQDDLKKYRPLTIKDAAGLNPEVSRRYVLAPKWNLKQDADHQEAAHARIFAGALHRAFVQTGWTVAIDELEYINRDLKVTSPLDRLYRQGRSQGNSVFGASQRPRWVTLHAYEQATHLFIWRMADMGNIIRAAELAGVNRQLVSAIVPTLDKHDVLYVNTITGDTFTTNTRWE